MKRSRYGMWLLALLLWSAGSVKAQYLQFIHDSEDSALAEVSVWLDTVLIDNYMTYRQSSPRIPLSPQTTYRLSITHTGSVDTTGALFSADFTTGDDGLMVGVLDGFISAVYAGLPPLALNISGNLPLVAGIAGNSDILFYHGAADFGTANLSEISLLETGVFSDVSFGSFADPWSVESLTYRLQTRDSGDAHIVAENELRLINLGLEDSSIVLVYSGFRDANAYPGATPAKWYLAFADGGNFTPLPQSTATVQWVHNSVDSAVSEVSVLDGDAPLVNELGFRTATAPMSIASGVTHHVIVVPAGSSDPGDSLLLREMAFEANQRYILVLSGMDDAGYPNFEALSWIRMEVRDAAHFGYNTDVMVINGNTDADGLSVDEVTSLNQRIAGPMLFGQSTAYTPLPVADYTLHVHHSGSGSPVLKYHAPLLTNGSAGKTAHWVFSGQLTPVKPDSSDALGLYSIPASGGMLRELTAVTGLDEIANVERFFYPNPTAGLVYLRERVHSQSIQVHDAHGNLVFEALEPVRTVDLSDLPDALYFVTLQSEVGRSVHPLVLIR